MYKLITYIYTILLQYDTQKTQTYTLVFQKLLNNLKNHTEITAKFNFVSEQYEKFTSNISERKLPSIYLESDPAQTQTLFDLKFFPRVIPKARHFYDFNYILMFLLFLNIYYLFF